MVESIVKPLEWKDFSYKETFEHHAWTPWGGYKLEMDKNFDWPFIIRPLLEQQSNYQSAEEAKAAAQADYERRILSALSVDPASFQALKDENVAKDARIAELLTALKTYLAAEQNTGNPELSIKAYDRACEKAYQQALAAVAKAEGRSNA